MSTSDSQPSSSTAIHAETALYASAATEASRRLREAVPQLAHRVNDQCTELERRLSGAKLQALQRSVAARAQELTPLYRANIMARARQLQKSRLALVQQLQRLSKPLSTSREARVTDRHAPTVFPHVQAVLGTAYAAMEAERSLGSFEQPLRPSQPAFSAFLTKAGAPEHGLPARLAEIKARQTRDARAAMAKAKDGLAAPVGERALPELDDALNVLVEEALELLLDGMEAHTHRLGTSRRAHSRTHVATAVQAGHSHSGNKNRSDAVASPVTHVVVNEEGSDGEDEHSSGSDSVVAVSADGGDADVVEDREGGEVQHIKGEHASVVLRWPVLLTLEQYSMDMPEAVEEAHARLTKRIAISKSGKVLNAEAEARLASTIGFYLSALGTASSEAETSVNPAHVMPSAGYGRDSDDDTDGDAHGGGSLRLSEKEKLVATLTHTILEHVDAAWRTLRIPSSLSTDESALNALEDLVDVVRLRYVVEVVSMVVAAWSAVPLITESDDGRFFELNESREVRLYTLSSPITAPGGMSKGQSNAGSPVSPVDLLRASVPARVLVLPGLSQLFYCLCYGLGAALLGDAAQCTVSPAPASTPARDEEAVDAEVDWSCLFADTFLAPPAASEARAPRPHISQWWRVWLYLWDCVVHVGPSSPGTEADGASRPTESRTSATQSDVQLPLVTARRWLERLLAAWKDRALADTALLLADPIMNDSKGAGQSAACSGLGYRHLLRADERALNVEAVLQGGRHAVMAMWRAE